MIPTAMEDGLQLRAGTIDDYDRLARHHYKSGRPVTCTSVHVLERRMPSVVGRYLGRGSEGEIVGVLLTSLPRLSCVLRDVATGGRYTGLEYSQRAQLLNREVRVISRVVVDPRYRGQGLAVRLVRAALANAATPYTEAIAAMGRVNPFFEHAGMARYERPPRQEPARLSAALEEMGIQATDLASAKRVEAILDARGPAARAFFWSEMTRWAATSMRMSRADRSRLTNAGLLALARDRLVANPVYYLYRKERDLGFAGTRCGFGGEDHGNRTATVAGQPGQRQPDGAAVA